MTAAWAWSLARVASGQLFAGESSALHLPLCLLFPQPPSPHPLQPLQVGFAICCFYRRWQILPSPQHPAGLRKYPFISWKRLLWKEAESAVRCLRPNHAWRCVDRSGAAHISVSGGVSRPSLGSGSGVTGGTQSQSSMMELRSSYPTSACD